MKKEIFDRAQAIMTSRRMSAVSENERRITEINQKLPQIREINDAVYNTSRDLVSLFASGKKADISAKIEQLKNYNLGAQQMSKKILVENGYPENYLDIQYNCNACQDTGYFGERFCSCFNKLCGKLAADEMNVTSHLMLSTFNSFSLSYYSNEDFQIMKGIYEFTKQYAANFTTNSTSILMLGKAGRGKTHLSLAIANEVLNKGYSVIYDSVINILRKIENEYFSKEYNSEATDLILSTDLLIIDDLGTEFEKQFYTSQIYNIVNTRYNKRLPTIINTNLNRDELRKKYEERVTSRIFSTYEALQFCGKDIRMQKKIDEINKR